MTKADKIWRYYTPPGKRCAYLGVCRGKGVIAITTDYVGGGARRYEKACLSHAGTMVVYRTTHEYVTQVMTQHIVR